MPTTKNFLGIPTLGPGDAGKTIVWNGTEFEMQDLGDTIADAILAAQPVGSTISWPQSSAPDGWFACDGSSKDATEYPLLYEALGGASNPWGIPLAGFFNLPDFQNRFELNQGVIANIGDTGGDSELNLTTDMIPAHTHSVGTLAIGSESSHTHGSGTLVNASHAGHDHGAGTLDTANESAHTHNPGSFKADDHQHKIDRRTDAHAHDGSAVRLVSGTGAVDVTGGTTTGNPVDITGTSTSGTAHNHAVTGRTADGGSHGHVISGSTAAGSSHTHSISGSTGNNSTTNIPVPILPNYVCYNKIIKHDPIEV